MKRILLLLVTLLLSGVALAAVNINTATKEELDALPGIGPVKAQAIIDYRKANGPFKTSEDIMKVRGIKEGEFGKIKNDITVSGASTGAAAKPAASAKATDTKAAETKPMGGAKAGEATMKADTARSEPAAAMKSDKSDKSVRTGSADKGEKSNAADAKAKSTADKADTKAAEKSTATAKDEKAKR